MTPIVAITMGDATGVGPEIIVKALDDIGIYNVCKPLVIGDKKIMERAAGVIGRPMQFRSIRHFDAAQFVYGTVDVIDMDNLPLDLPYAAIDARAGKAAFEYIAKSVNLAMDGKIAAITTAPINKEAMNEGGYIYPGHTEILAELSGTKDYSMMLASETLRVIHVTTHVSMRRACELITRERVARTIRLAYQAMRDFGIEEPRIAVAGLNAHSGEGGMFGSEEIDEIVPAIADATQLGWNVTGPVSPDTVFFRAVNKREFDIVVCMYHDQGHIPMKLLAFETGVNVTVGLPFIRTSVDHGTAFDKAGKGTADHRSMTEALYLAAKMGRFK